MASDLQQVRDGVYPLVNIQKTMENHQFQWVNHGKSTINGHFQSFIATNIAMENGHRNSGFSQ